VHNNPMNYTDPLGYGIWDDIVDIICGIFGCGNDDSGGGSGGGHTPTEAELQSSFNSASGTLSSEASLAITNSIRSVASVIQGRGDIGSLFGFDNYINFMDQHTTDGGSNSNDEVLSHILKSTSHIKTEKIREAQQLLGKLGFYQGNETGFYTSDLYFGTMAYQKTLNKWDLGVALNVSIHGEEGYLSEDGIINDRLLHYATRDVNLGMNSSGSIYDVLFVGDAIIVGLGAEAAVGTVAAGVTTLRFVKKGIQLIKGKGNIAFQALSKGKVKHVLNRHSFNNVQKQLQHEITKRSKTDVANDIAERSFFNKNWSNTKITEATENAYNQLLQKGITNGRHTVKVSGEKITVQMNDGVFQSAWGSHKYKLSDFGF
jgi:hypothetical protein